MTRHADGRAYDYRTRQRHNEDNHSEERPGRARGAPAKVQVIRDTEGGSGQEVW
jgi:hypothetical protein